MSEATSDVQLSRRATAEALTARGFPIAESTLATKATRGGGPPYKRFGKRAVYKLAEALQWAESVAKPCGGA